ncbi:MAG: hypothetical protein ACP5NQ_00385 [Vulcanisaeta sp.]
MSIGGRIEECVKNVCSNYVAVKASCTEVPSVGEGVYVISDGKTTIIGYSRNVRDRLLRYCRGDLDIRGIALLLMGNLEHVIPNVKAANDTLARRGELRRNLVKIISSADIFVVSCPGVRASRLYEVLSRCLG